MAGGVDPEVVPMLVEVKQNLEQDLGLEALARTYGYSPFHFHRLFSKAVGETPKRHVDRLRLERAAYKLAVTEDAIVDVGFAVGFASHESFSRAFRRWFGRSPSAYRKAAKAAQRERMVRMDGFTGDGCRISAVRFVQRRPMPMLAVRRLGAYEAFGPVEQAAIWDEIAAWAEARGIPVGDMRLGLFPDDPGMTPAALQSADLCIPILRSVEGDARVRGIELAGGIWGVIEHFGPYGTVGQAYRTLADGIRRSDYQFRDEPPVQVFREVGIGGDPDANRSEVWFPVRRKKRQAGGSAPV